MGLGAFTKELAKQAVDSLRPADLGSIADNLTGAKAVAPAADTSLGSMLLAQVQAMQNALKDDQELVVLCETAVGPLRVLEIFVPAWRVAVLTGIDSEKVVTRVICPFESLQLICKPMSVIGGAKPVRLRFVAPKA